jgi:pimeloyl-ACP methyl ester carboxylesterase
MGLSSLVCRPAVQVRWVYRRKAVIVMPRAGRPRQAVVLIHGIGEQMPMVTTRGFVKSIRPKKNNNKGWDVYSEADQADETFELHTYAVPPRHPADPKALQTDFYEGYWAQEASGTKLEHVWRWIRRVFFTGLFRAPGRLRGLYWLAAGLAVLFLASIPVLLLTPAGTAISSSVPRIVVQWVVPAILAAMTGWMVKSLGDLARYTDDSPDNIEMRQNIRQRVVGLLEKLHNDERYTRIIVVGHSLGGVVAYDALRLLWAKRTSGDNGTTLGLVDDGDVAKAAQSLMSLEPESLQSLAPVSAKSDPVARQKLMDFCARQYELQEHLSEDAYQIQVQAIVNGRQQLVRRPAWKVTDLVTLGSPIAYPELLLADGNPGEFRDLVEERQLPTCPPQPVRGDGYRYEGTSGEGKRYHHGAMFAFTRWTNAVARGDFAGAPIIAGTLGSGVVNKELRGLPLRSHSKYWVNPRGREIISWVIDEPEKCYALIINADSRAK